MRERGSVFEDRGKKVGAAKCALPTHVEVSGECARIEHEAS